MYQAVVKDAMDTDSLFVVGIIIIIIIITQTPLKIIASPFERLVRTASPPPPIVVVVVAAVGGGVVDGGVVDQAVAKDAMDAETSFVVGIIIIAPTPPKIIAPPFE